LNTQLDLFWTFVKIGAGTFGGGYAMLPLLERELVEKRQWITQDNILEYYSVGQSTPGIIAVNVSTFVGYHRSGVFGAIISTLGFVLPSFFIISLLASIINQLDQIPQAQSVLIGIRVGVAALLAQTLLSFSKKSIKDISGLFIFLSVCVVAWFVPISPIWIILGVAVLGGPWYWIRKKLKTHRNTPGPKPPTKNQTNQTQEER
jgi:chromate transporter